jgi:carboxypeptidase family protein/TonB-dependent receptor-like protein
MRKGLQSLASSVVFCLVLTASVLPASAQLYTGSIAGTVTDPSGAVIVSAHVTATDLDKGFKFPGTTDNAGRYVLRNIPPGRYEVSVEAPNFESQRKTGVVIAVTQNATVDFTLKIGAASQTIEVQAQQVELQTEDAVTGQVVNRTFVNDLPLLDRNFANLAYLAPGVNETNVAGTQGSNGGINFNSNGSRNSTADVLIDGASATNFEQNSGLQNVPYNPSVDSVEEFKVQQSNFTAEYGFAGGTIINVVTRSGTNKFHGSAYEFLRNSATDANNWFNPNKDRIAALKRNNFGFTVGGPIKKDKTFFFFDYEGTRETSAATSGGMGVPSLCERGLGPCPAGQQALGNFSELCILQGGSFDPNGLCSIPSGQLWDPYSGSFNPDPAGDGSLGGGAVRSTFIPFNDLSSYTSSPSLPGNVAVQGTPFQLPPSPGNLINPVARNLFLLFPKPTFNATDLTTLQNSNFSSSGSNTNSQDQFDIKVDHRFSDRDLLSARYSQSRGSSTSFNCFGSFADPCTSGPARFTRHAVAINHVHTFSPTLVLNVAFGYVRGFDNAQGTKGAFPNIGASFSQLGIPSYLNNGFGVLPQILISGYSSGNAGNNIGTQAFIITREGQDSGSLGGAVSWLRGKHEWKFGGEGRLHRINHGNPGWPAGNFTFDFSSTSQIATQFGTDNNGLPLAGGDGLASFLTGVGSPNQSGGGCTPCQQGFDNFVSTESFRYAAFAQDNFRVSPRLTLNLGLRYELSLPRTERFNRMNWLDPNALSPLQVAGLPPLHGIEVFASPNDRSNYYTDYKAIQPRFGFAYQLPHALVVRGGYGIYYSTPRSGASGTGPWGFQGYNIQPPWLTTLNIDHATPWNTLSNTSCLFTAPFACGVAPPPGNTLGAFNDIGFAAVGPIRRESQNIPYEQTWSFGFQKELPGRVVLDTNYVGKKGTHLYLGGFREHNYVPLSAIAGMTPNQIGNTLTAQVPNPFFFGGSGTCDPTKFICDPTSGLAGPTVQASQLLVPFPQYNGFQGDSPPIATSIYHALQVRAEKDFAHGLQFLVTYAWSKSIDTASASDDSFSFLGGGTPGGSTLGVQNPFNLRAERAVSVFDIPQVFQVSYVWEFPVGRGRLLGRNMNAIANAIIGGWQTNGIIRIDDGRPIIPILVNGGTPIPTYGQRPDLTGILRRAAGSPEKSVNNGPFTGTSYFANPDALSTPASFTFGSAPRTISTVLQPGARDVSMSIFKEFPLSKLREGMRVEFRAESFNTFNHPHFQGPDTTVGSTTFGLITGVVNSPRQLQLALKVYF